MYLLSVDAEKAFDRVHWGFLRATRKHIGIGDTLLGRNIALYTNPSAQIRLNVQLSSPFSIHIGTRQGSPSPPYM